MANTPKKLINDSRKDLTDFMRGFLEDISANLILDVMRNYKSLRPAQKIESTKGVKIKGTQKYRSDIKEAMAIIAREAINQAKKEVPSRIKFAEYDKLPKKIRDRIDAKTRLLIDAQIADLEKNVFFDFTNKVATVDSEKAIQGSMTETALAYINGPTISAGASSMAASTVNEARQAYFYEEEVFNEIQAFKYINTTPVSAICTELAGHVFDKNDPELSNYQPPFHFNCDGYLVPVLAKTKLAKPPEKFIPSKKAQKSIQFGECACGSDHDHDSIGFKLSTIKFQEAIVPEVKNPREGNLQTIIVSKEVAKNLEQAKQIAKDVGAKNLTVDETETQYRFRQRNPGDFVSGSFRSKKIEGKGAILVYGKLA